MATPKAFAALREKEKAAAAAAEERRNMELEREKVQQDTIYNNLCKSLGEYHNATLDDHKIKIFIPSKPAYTIHIYVDDYHWVTVSVVGQYHYCRCEGPCDCGHDFSVLIKAIQHKKKEDRSEWFLFSSDVGNPDRVAYAMSKMLKDFQWKDF